MSLLNKKLISVRSFDNEYLICERGKSYAFCRITFNRDTKESEQKLFTERIIASGEQSIVNVRNANGHYNDCVNWEKTMVSLLGTDSLDGVKKLISKLIMDNNEMLELIKSQKADLLKRGIHVDNAHQYEKMRDLINKVEHKEK